MMSIAEKFELFTRTLQSKGLDTLLHDQIRSVSAVLPPSGAVVFDVGANVGNWTAALLATLGSAIEQVHCFEPVAANVQTIRGLRDPRVSVHPFGVGARNEEREFYSDFTGSGIASLFKRDTADAPAMPLVERIEIRRLDDVVAELGLSRIDLVKMDIEGAEMDALHGLHGSIDSGVVRAFTFEIGSVNITAKIFLSDFFNLATAKGFRVYRLTAGGGLFEIKNYRVSQECFATTNYLASRVEPRV